LFALVLSLLILLILVNDLCRHDEQSGEVQETAGGH
jgi:hypothetical protein